MKKTLCLSETEITFQSEAISEDVSVWMGVSETITAYPTSIDQLIVTWDGIEHGCQGQDIDGVMAYGNAGILNVMFGASEYEDTGEPFLLAFQDGYGAMFYTLNADSTHVVTIYIVSPELVLKDKNGLESSYPIDLPIVISDDLGGEQEYSHGVVVDGVTIELDLYSGDQSISVPDGQLVKRATITKPATLLPENIKNGVVIAGVYGRYNNQKPEMTTSVGLYMPSGNQVITPNSGYVFTKVTVQKPSTLTPANIKKGVTIGGVTGTAITDTFGATREADFATGNMVISATSTAWLSSVTITKPTTLIPENVVQGITIAGVAGSHECPTTESEEKTVDPDFSSGDIMVEPSDGKLISKATIIKPDTLIPENIVKDVIIAGVTGTHKCAGGGIVDVETEAKMDAILVAENIGKYYRYIGGTTDNYIQGDIYLVEDDSA